jgi:hypothetical protein
MKTLSLRPGLLVLFGLTLAVSAHAARPLVTDDTGVLDRGHCELEAALSQDKADGVRADGSALQLGCGVGGNLQIALAADRVKVEGLRVRGNTLAAKLALLPGDDASWSASAAVLWAAQPRESHRHAASALNLLHSRALGGNWTLHANVGHLRDALSRRSATTWGLALEHAGWGPVALMGELMGDDLAAPAWNIGVRWYLVPAQWVLDAAYGRQMVGGQPSTLSMGLKLAF